MKAPTRFFEDPTLRASLRADLEEFAARPVPYDVDRGAANLAAALAALDVAPGVANGGEGGAPGASGVGAGMANSWPVVVKVVAAVLGTSALGAGAYQLSQQEAEPVAAPVVASTREAAPRAAPPLRAAKIDAPPSSSRVVQPSASDVPAGDRAFGGAPAEPGPRRPSASRREIAQLVRIRELLASDPAAAYRLARASQREFPGGSLREEREGLAVIAAFGMDDAARARHAADRFLTRYPQSPLRDRIRRLFERPRGSKLSSP